MKKKGTDEISNAERSQLKSKLISLKNKWESTNGNKKSNYISNESAKGALFMVLGAVVGGLIAGPPGAIFGGALGGAGSATKSVVSSEGYDNDADCGANY